LSTGDSEIVDTKGTLDPTLKNSTTGKRCQPFIVIYLFHNEFYITFYGALSYRLYPFVILWQWGKTILWNIHSFWDIYISWYFFCSYYLVFSVIIHFIFTLYHNNKTKSPTMSVKFYNNSFHFSPKRWPLSSHWTLLALCARALWATWHK
jgi:hypothetical protein